MINPQTNFCVFLLLQTPSPDVTAVGELGADELASINVFRSNTPSVVNVTNLQAAQVCTH